MLKKILFTIQKNDNTISTILLTFCCLIYIVSAVINLRYNVDSVYDEGFLFNSIQETYSGKISGMTQYKNIITSFLPYEICNSIYFLRVSRLILTILTAIIFYLITAPIFFKKYKKSIGYFVLCLFFVTPVLDGIVLSYNGLAQFFLSIIIGLAFYVYNKETILSYVATFFIGVLLIFSVFTILPSALLLGFCIVCLFIYRFWSNRNLLIKYILFASIGIITGLLLMHFFVYDLESIFSAMQKTASSVTTLNRGYDPLSFLIKIVLFLRDWAFCVFMVIGVLCISDIFRKNKYYVVSSLIFIVSILLYLHYQEKPRVTYSMFLIFLFIVCIYDRIFTNEINIKNVLNFDCIFNVFLIISPIILSIGTNVYLGGKMSYFLLPWAILLYRVGWKSNLINYRMELSIIFLLISLISLKDIDNKFTNDVEKVERGPLKEMFLTSKQSSHFRLCSDIVSKYNFKPKESVIYGTQLSAMTICYLEAVNCANYFQPMDFLDKAKNDSLKQPDFIFLCKYDKDISGDAIKETNWGWPEEFDEYYVGTPENQNYGYPTERWLYCRKKCFLE